MADDLINTSLTFDSFIQRFPLEIIAKIVAHLSTTDIINLTAVSKVWRSVFLNQNIIWKRVCENLHLKEEDYIHCLVDVARNDANCKGYVETNSERYFGPCCKWWTIYNRFNMVIKNIMNNEIPIMHLKRKLVGQSFYTDDYIVNVNHYRSTTLEVLILQGNNKPSKTRLQIMISMRDVFRNRKYKLKMIGNKKYLILEMHSILMVYGIEDGDFVPLYTLTVKRSVDNVNSEAFPDTAFMDKNPNTLMDLSGDYLALIQPINNVIFLVDLRIQKICKELVYTSKKCVVDCMKCVDNRLMIGITIKDKNNIFIKHYYAIIYHLDDDDCKEDVDFKIPLFGAVKQFKVTQDYIGVENTALQTPIISKKSKLVNVFWIDCDTFSFDSTRKMIYYNINQSIYQYDLIKSRVDGFEVMQKIAIDLVSPRYSLAWINDRFLLVHSVAPLSYEIFDVKRHVSVKSIQIEKGFKLEHVGSLSVVFASRKEFIIVRFF